LAERIEEEEENLYEMLPTVLSYDCGGSLMKREVVGEAKEARLAPNHVRFPDAEHFTSISFQALRSGPSSGLPICLKSPV
jgi:hypothetical protein